MNPIVHITTQQIGTEETNTVNARELHGTLMIGKDFSTWIKGQFVALDLDENVDYIAIPQKRGVANGGYKTVTEYHLTLDTAKHIAMASRTPQGKQVRHYFIEIEKAHRHATAPQLARMQEQIDRLAQAQQRRAIRHRREEEVLDFDGIIARLKTLYRAPTIKKLRTYLGISKGTYDGWRRTGRIPQRKLTEIAEYSGVHLHWLRHGLGEKYLPHSAAPVPTSPAVSVSDAPSAQAKQMIQQAVSEALEQLIPTIEQAARKQFTVDDAVRLIGVEQCQIHEQYCREHGIPIPDYAQRSIS